MATQSVAIVTTSKAWTCPAGVTAIAVYCLGKGGNGVAPNGAGGGGAAASVAAMAVTPGTIYNVEITDAFTRLIGDSQTCGATAGQNGANGAGGLGGQAGDCIGDATASGGDADNLGGGGAAAWPGFFVTPVATGGSASGGNRGTTTGSGGLYLSLNGGDATHHPGNIGCGGGAGDQGTPGAVGIQWTVPLAGVTPAPAPVEVGANAETPCAYSFTRTENVAFPFPLTAHIKAYGGGGGGGWGRVAPDAAFGGGGGGGAYASGDVQVGFGVYTVEVGGGGVGGVFPGLSAHDGDPSFFVGDDVTVQAAGGKAGAPSLADGAGGAIVDCTGTVTTAGSDGQSGFGGAGGNSGGIGGGDPGNDARAVGGGGGGGTETAPHDRAGAGFRGYVALGYRTATQVGKLGGIGGAVASAISAINRIGMG